MQNIIAIVSAVFVGITLIANSIQAREVARQTQLQTKTNQALLMQNAESSLERIMYMLFENPELRKYFYSNTPGPTSEPDKTRVQVLAGLFVDFMGLTVRNSEYFPSELRDIWYAYFRDMVRNSMVLRIYWRENRQWSDSALHDILDGTVLSLAKFDASNTPVQHQSHLEEYSTDEQAQRKNPGA